MTDFVSSRHSLVAQVQNAIARAGADSAHICGVPFDLRIAQRTTLGILGALLLTGCSLPLVKHGDLNDRLKEDLGRGAAERKSNNAGIDTALMPPLQIEEPKLTAESEARFDLSVVGAPAAQVFMALVTGTRYSMLLPADLSGSLTVNLKDVTIKEALETIRELYGYEFKFQGTRIFIQSNALQSRVFQINYLATRRQGSSELRVASTSMSPSGGGGSTGAATPASPTPASGTGGKGADTSRVSTSSDSDFWRDLNSAMISIVGSADGRSVIVNPMSGVIVVRAFPNELRNVENYLKATQLVVERQVMLEAKIIAVTLSNGAQSGINWSIFNSVSNGRSVAGVLGPNANLNTTTALQAGSGLTLTPGKNGSAVTNSLTNGFVGLAFQTANFAALLSFLETQGDVAVLSSPRIATINNQKALLKVGSDDMFVVNVSGGTPTTTTVAGTAPTVTLQPFFSGISLDVTPQIDDEGNIILHVHPAVSTVTEVEKVIDLGSNGGIFKLPLPSSSINETDSIVRVQDGNIVAIGGLMKQEQQQARSQLPGIGESALGFLLGQRSSSASKTEMVILIKPTIINNDRVWQDDLQGVRDRVQGLNPNNPASAPSPAPKAASVAPPPKE